MTAMKPCPECHSAEHPHIGVTDDGLAAGRSVEAGCTGCHTPAQTGYVPTGPSADECRPDGVQSARGGMGIATTGEEYPTMGGIESKPIPSPSTELWKSDSPAAMAGLKESPVPAARGVKRGAAAIGYTPGGGSAVCRRTGNGGHARGRVPLPALRPDRHPPREMRTEGGRP